MNRKKHGVILHFFVLFILSLPFFLMRVGSHVYDLLYILLVSVFFLIRKKTPDSVTLLVCTVFFMIAAADIFLRFFYAEHLYAFAGDRYRFPYPKQKKFISRYSPNVLCSGEAFGDLASMTADRSLRQYRKVIFKTDSLGLRNSNEVLYKPVDIIILGDSFTAGQGITQEKMVAALIQEKTGKTVYNFSVEACGPWEEFMRVKKNISSISLGENPQLLWFVFSGNDFDEECYDDFQLHDSQLYDLYLRFQTFRIRSPLKKIILRAYASLFVSRSNSVIIKEFINGRKIIFYKNYALPKKAEDIYDSEKSRQLSAVFSEMKTLTNEMKIKLKIFFIPSKEEVYSWVLQNRNPFDCSGESSVFGQWLKQFCEQEGIFFTDLTGYLMECSKEQYENTGDIIWWYDDSHWNEAGNRYVSDKIIQIVR